MGPEQVADTEESAPLRRSARRWLLVAAAAVVVIALTVSWFVTRPDRNIAGNDPDLLPWACGQSLSPLEGVTVRGPGALEQGVAGQLALTADRAFIAVASVRVVALTPQGSVGSHLTGEDQKSGDGVGLTTNDLPVGGYQAVTPVESLAPCADTSSSGTEHHVLVIAVVDDTLRAMDAGPLDALRN